MRSLLLLLVTLVAACGSPKSSPRPPALTAIAGMVRNAAGQPVAGATIYAYRNARSGLRGPADFAAQSADDGSYLLDLAPGSYHLVARLRKGGSDSGPPRPGDAWALPASNPLTLSEHQLQHLDFTLQQIHDQRLIASTLSNTPFAFQGQIVTPSGGPLAEAMVLAYRQPELHRRPDFASHPTAPDGRFTLYLPDSGPWCLVVRQYTRGQLRSNELYTLLGYDQDRCRLRATPDLDLGTIVVSPFAGQ